MRLWRVFDVSGSRLCSFQLWAIAQERRE
jgi:hypothetical protein